MTLKGRVALVTGSGGSGMGRSIALTLARDGADIVLNYDRTGSQAAETQRAIEAMGRRAIVHSADVGDASAVDDLVNAGVEAFGKVDIVVGNAGAPWKPQDVTEITPEHLRRVIGAEIEGAYHLLRAALPGMRDRKWGRFVFIGGHMADDWRFGPPDAPLDYPLGRWSGSTASR
jgi:NAD(P)-dependent dehydrogenase (short-subunit alcohol dehydrogenase family)